jgi:hypothetical protein
MVLTVIALSAAASGLCHAQATSGVPATDWQRVGATAGATVYFQAGSLRRDGQIRRISELQDLKAPDPDGVMSRRYEAEYECRHDMVRIGRIGSFAGPLLSGEKLFDVREMGYWRKIPPGSPFSALHALVCADYDGPRG